VSEYFDHPAVDRQTPPVMYRVSVKARRTSSLSTYAPTA